MATLAHPCTCCRTPVPGGARYCPVCGTATSGGDPPDLERVRGALAERYAVERVLGEGGTATVYLAEDLRHRRKVAVKVLRPEIASLVGAGRFLHEIEIAARLQHPHILPVYDSGEAVTTGDDPRRLLFYVMPVAEESLAARLARGPLPPADAVRILAQVADALAFAHAQGIIHRDIKPDNVLLAGRHAMVADFGIAKALTLPVGRQPRTGPNVPIGTPYYMSPEQVAGDPDLDGRADQYALGVVAYEMLAGRRPFTGETIQAVLAAQVLETPEPLSRYRPELPAALAHVVMRCLEKEPARRWPRSDEVAERLEVAGRQIPGATPRSRFHWVAGAAILAALAAGPVLATTLVRRPIPAAPMADQISFDGSVGTPAISPDGKRLAYASREEGVLRVQELGGGPPLDVVGGLTNVLALRWSPDGTRLLAGGWFEGEPGVHVVSALGGRPHRVGHARLGQWHPSGTQVSLWDYPDKSLVQVDLSSGDSVVLALPGTYDWLYDAEWSPSGLRLAYVTMSEPDHYTLRMVDPDGSNARTILEDTLPIGSLRWAPDEQALYYLSGSAELRKVKLTRSRGAAAGEPMTLLDGMQAGPSEVPGVLAPFTLTADAGRLVYLKALEYSNLWEVTGDPRTPRGRFATRRLTSGTALRRGAAVSPDRRWVAYLETSNEGTDLYRTPLDGGRPERLTHGGRVASRRPAWSPDGSRLLYGARDEGVVRLATVGADGGEEQVLVGTSLPAMGDIAWAPSPRILHQVAGNRNFRLLDPVSGRHQWLISPDAPGWVFAAQPSPDGERVAVYWNRRPLNGVWVVSGADASAALLRAGRLEPVGWSEDGRSVLAADRDTGTLVRLGLDGRTDSLGRLPFRDSDCATVEGGGAGRLVCVVPEQVSDVWMVAGFDPESR